MKELLALARLNRRGLIWAVVVGAAGALGSEIDKRRAEALDLQREARLSRVELAVFGDAVVVDADSRQVEGQDEEDQEDGSVAEASPAAAPDETGPDGT